MNGRNTICTLFALFSLIQIIHGGVVQQHVEPIYKSAVENIRAGAAKLEENAEKLRDLMPKGPILSALPHLRANANSSHGASSASITASSGSVTAAPAAAPGSAPGTAPPAAPGSAPPAAPGSAPPAAPGVAPPAAPGSAPGAAPPAAPAAGPAPASDPATHQPSLLKGAASAVSSAIAAVTPIIPAPAKA